MNSKLQHDPLAGCKLFAPDEYWASSEEDVDQVTGGCGPGKWGDYLVPDSFMGLSIWACCRVHDFCYYIQHPKAMSDVFFLANMILLIHHKSGKLLRLPRMLLACKYFLAVYFGGSGAYEG
ncbi:MAG: hypothetical protein ACLFMQ_01720 [Desulfohalobiaceae bacterium]